MEAPFSRIGSGQSARCVVQVMGKRGPIFNPTGIRYLPASTSAPAGNPLAGQPLVVAGFLVAGAAIMAVIAKSFEERSGMADVIRELDRVRRDQEEQIRRLHDEVRTDNAVNRLAREVEAARAEACAVDGSINLKTLGELARDLHDFMRRVDVSPRVSTSFLGSSTRRRLAAITNLLHRLRMDVASNHNASREEHADDHWLCHSIYDYLPKEKLVLDLASYSMVREWLDVCEMIHNRPEDFDHVHHEKLQRGILNPVLCARWEGMVPDDHATALLALEKVAESEACHNAGWKHARTRWQLPEFFECFSDLVVRRTIDLSSYAFPEKVLEDERDGLVGSMERHCARWLYQTDSGLITRAFVECAGIESGYDAFVRGSSRSLQLEDATPELPDVAADSTIELPFVPQAMIAALATPTV